MSAPKFMKFGNNHVINLSSITHIVKKQERSAITGVTTYFIEVNIVGNTKDTTMAMNFPDSRSLDSYFLELQNRLLSPSSEEPKPSGI